MRVARWSPLAALLAGCGGERAVVVFAPPELEPAFSGFSAGIGERMELRIASDPEAERRRGRVAVLADLDCGECFRIEADDRGWVVHGGGPLGAQYGLSALFELGGMRFFHPYQTYVPEDFALPEEHEQFGLEQSPEQSLRGLHLHTLHPIEGYFDFWEPGDQNREGASRVIDWVIKNRGNYLQWVALDDIQDNDAALSDWQDHTISIVDEAHARGLEVGLGVQLFGSGNLQLAFDLLDDPGTPEEQREALEARLSPVLGVVDFDRINLSFGEFFGEEPAAFIDSVNLAGEVMHELSPELDVTTVVHVGADQRVEYEGQEMIYYFLATYADASLTPWVHSVMYYNLFEDAGGAYHHEVFDEHRELLLSRLRAGQPVAYFPESAYWIAFDNPIPTYLPLYVRSRFLDMASIRAESEAGGHPDLSAHVLFSSGWEWGYWQQDMATLRMGWALPERYEDFFGWAFAFEGGEALAETVVELTELEHAALITGRLAPYLASYDNVMELGYNLDILSQPKRVLFDEMAELDGAALAAFEADTLVPLRAFADALAALAARAPAPPAEGPARPWVAETLDGLEITALRARFIASLYEQVAAHLRGESASLDEAEALLADAEPIVARRHAALHDPRGERLTTSGGNATIYQYGYLIRADELCFWRRELVLAREILSGVSEVEPGCSL